MLNYIYQCSKITSEGKVLKMATFLNRIEAIGKEMTNSEKKIVKVLLNSEKPFLLTMNELSKLSGVSEPSVVRFYRRLGYSSYQELKVALAQENLNEAEPANIFEEIELGDSPQQVFEKVVEQSIIALNTTKHMINYEALNHAAELIGKAKRLFFFGHGSSGIIAEDAAHKFLRLGETAISMNDAHMQSIAASHMNEDDVIFAISHSGESRDLLEVLKQAKANGARLIVITGFSKSSIAQMADALLVTSAKETEFRSDAMVSRIVQLAIIDSLSVITVLRKGKVAIDAVNRSRLAVAKLKT
ncbi:MULTISPECIES: MurR/RpiR family transcriptional regulator [unclassified Geobacillus]|uniref:MurR/RpiR family transcriptional regulator n=1 Tax=unclassified Geobacillus TaxID=2642459 RepID=UPI00101316B9|nr:MULTISPECIES: MurR/RpiR family transcriptional regulator [unclassified Geobacillus]MCG6796565.1 MurR/RpiR family transcriptional regulator [Geobacillus sp. YHL]RXS86500.1 MurR/RpiR family transcriptional regulator [Geobacillus sp. PK12]